MIRVIHKYIHTYQAVSQKVAFVVEARTLHSTPIYIVYLVM
jgi:hypothetical protein